MLLSRGKKQQVKKTKPKSVPLYSFRLNTGMKGEIVPLDRNIFFYEKKTFTP
jgi:hypothetical protein